MDALDCQPTDEIFTHTDIDGTVRHFNTSAMARALAHKKVKPDYATVKLYPELIIALTQTHGVEEEGVQRIMGDHERLQVPIFVAKFDDPPHPQGYESLIIDGSHRCVARWRLGLTEIDALFFRRSQWEPFLVTGFDVPHVIGEQIITPLGPEAAAAAVKAGIVQRPAPKRVKF